jgi:hypothetical protein
MWHTNHPHIALRLSRKSRRAASDLYHTKQRHRHCDPHLWIAWRTRYSLTSGCRLLNRPKHCVPHEIKTPIPTGFNTFLFLRKLTNPHLLVIFRSGVHKSVQEREPRARCILRIGRGVNSGCFQLKSQISRRLFCKQLDHHIHNSNLRKRTNSHAIYQMKLASWYERELLGMTHRLMWERN